MNHSYSVLVSIPVDSGVVLGGAALLLAIAGSVYMLRPVHDLWRRALTNLFFRDYYELGPTIQRFSQELGALREQGDVVNLLLDGLVETLNLSGVVFVGLPEGLDPSVLRLIEPDDLGARRDFATTEGRAGVLRGLVSVDLAASQLSWATPLMLNPWPGCAALVLIGPARGSLGLGLLVVGKKRAGGQLRRDDRMLLVTLAHQAGTALENAVLFAGLKISLAQVEVSTRQLVGARAEQQLLLRELVNADERQRAALARDLHDDALQEVLYLIRHSRLSVELVTALEPFMEPLEASPTQVLPTAASAPRNVALARLRAELTQLAERSVVVEQRLRALCLGLYPALLNSLGLQAALDDLANEHALTTGLRVALQWSNDALDATELLDPETALHVYRIAQEGLRNASKHAGASVAHVKLTLVRAPVPSQAGHHTSPHPLLQLDIQDDGPGIPLPVDYAALLREGHLGLAGMRERAQRIGGTLVIERAADGTHIRLLVPVDVAPPRTLVAEARRVQRTHEGNGQ
ncbi:MAG TPA: ATP-binding protein [Ktedonobacterales bacterium]|nr:ATP-binding protein [Ktedonobacterales bacterium]